MLANGLTSDSSMGGTSVDQFHVLLLLSALAVLPKMSCRDLMRNNLARWTVPYAPRFSSLFEVNDVFLGVMLSSNFRGGKSILICVLKKPLFVFYYFIKNVSITIMNRLDEKTFRARFICQNIGLHRGKICFGIMFDQMFTQFKFFQSLFVRRITFCLIFEIFANTSLNPLSSRFC